MLCAWFAGITADLLLAGGFYDVALRDAALAVLAFAFARLAAAAARRPVQAAFGPRQTSAASR